MKTCYFLFPFLVAIQSCSHDSPGASPLSIENQQFERTLPGCGDKEKREEPCVTFRVAYPRVAAPANDARTKINSAILVALQPKDAPSGFQAESDKVVEDFQKFHKEFPDAPITYFIRRTAEVQYSSASMLSIVIDDEEFLGGAHPNSTRSYLNLNPATGEEITLRDILIDGALPKLTLAAENEFRNERAIPVNQKYSEAGFQFADDRFTLSPDWGVVPKGLVFHYNAYDIAPYSMGPTTFVVPWGKAADLVKSEARLLPPKK